MTDNSLGWIGEHWYSGAIAKDGMLSDISLTAVRGVDPVDFVVRLGADCGMAERPLLLKDFDRLLDFRGFRWVARVGVTAGVRLLGAWRWP
ncbi:hypothetical protein ACWEO4_43015 [Streptomyces sp. NPDC004393]|uniref:hypothetical protein n=1 Tax=Streptomyces sp. NPDC004533 TaxID=3154278 RepID=UPI0033A03F80